MTIELPSSLEAQLQDLASKEGRNVGTIVEEALRQYLESVAITDLESEQIAEAQIALASELPEISAWKVPKA
ncbi:MAG TPA: ribbon-helix-helix protein, CopG family [Polyangia bacterium]|jgi:predicted transcriptional regulator|nr:ribbon-helix-helix protein, CopG family [Polyangia bacterium]